jgi:hypothetical protein
MQGIFPLPNPSKIDREFDPKGFLFWTGKVPAEVWRK